MLLFRHAAICFRYADDADALILPLRYAVIAVTPDALLLRRYFSALCYAI